MRVDAEHVLLLGVKGYGTLDLPGGEIRKDVTPDSEVLDPGPRPPASIHHIPVREDRPEQIGDYRPDAKRSSTGPSEEGQIQWDKGERERHHDVD
eukprot:1194777-Prorocentrum_minimum.AAC.3